MLPSWQMAARDETGVGVGEAVAGVLDEEDAAGAAEEADEADEADDGGAAAEVPDDTLAAVAVAGDCVGAVVGVVVLLLAGVGLSLSLDLSAALTPFAVCDAGEVSGLKPPLPHTEAGGACAAAAGGAAVVGELDDGGRGGAADGSCGASSLTSVGHDSGADESGGVS